MPETRVRVAGPEEQDALIATLLLAFSGDPPSRWLLPGARDYLELYPKFAAAFGGRAFAAGTAFAVDDNRAVALWLPPGVEPDQEAFGAVIGAALARKAGGESPDIGERMAAFHPKTPHWYLPLIGVDPVAQGKGLGSALLKHVLALIDRDGATAYLESSNSKNVPLYERFGFEVQGFVEGGDFPGLWPMLRAARR
ncbi:MAG: GNAT family N-acetyltransferase [Caulobacteraceae bacterium]